MEQSSLNLVGDEDLERLLEDVFGLRFTDDELLSMVNVGAIHDVLERRIPSRPGSCETSMAFYRLRRGLAGTAGEVIRPSSPLPWSLTQRPKVELVSLAKTTGLRMPGWQFGLLGAAGCLLGLIAAVGLAAALVMQLPLLALGTAVGLIVTIFAMFADRGRLPRSLVTVGDLARATAPLNYGRLVREGGRSNSALLWVTLCEVVADVAELAPETIGRDTLIYPAKKAVA